MKRSLLNVMFVHGRVDSSITWNFEKIDRGLDLYDSL